MKSSSRKWMIYGANGYSGKLIARLALESGSQPVLAGRSRDSIYSLASELNCEARVFDVEDGDASFTALEDIYLVLNCAGPFVNTAPRLVSTCLQTQTHYLDLSGELEVFEHCYAQTNLARERAIVICPGVAFDVVPTESIALKLKQLMPDAVELRLGFDGAMMLSAGSMLSLLDGMSNQNLGLFMRRQDGVLISPPIPKYQRIAFGEQQARQKAMSITWADLNAAFYSTEIPNIEIFVPATIFNQSTFASMAITSPLLKYRGIRNAMENAVKRYVNGPSTIRIEKTKMRVFGEVRNAKGAYKRIDLTIPHGYKFTALSAFTFVKCCLSDLRSTGYRTPAQLVGPDFVQGIPGCSEYVYS